MKKVMPWVIGVLLTLPGGVALGGPPVDEAVAAVRAAAFEQADTNSDGVLTLEEFRILMELREEMHFARLDTNDDGTVSLEELTAGRGKPGRRGHRRGRGHRHGPPW